MSLRFFEEKFKASSIYVFTIIFILVHNFLFCGFSLMLEFITLLNILIYASILLGFQRKQIDVNNKIKV
jgi:hypothetical protein